MAKEKVSPSKKSKNRRTTEEVPSEGGAMRSRRSRAHRDDTPEARSQRAKTPKTHPTRSPTQVRKDSAGKHPKR